MKGLTMELTDKQKIALTEAALHVLNNSEKNENGDYVLESSGKLKMDIDSFLALSSGVLQLQR